jgi:hypothetical protein
LTGATEIQVNNVATFEPKAFFDIRTRNGAALRVEGGVAGLII